MFAFVLLCLLGGTVARKLTTNEFCRFDEVLKADLRQLPCDSDWNECASKARHLVQNKKFGSWGAVVLGNPDDISEGKIDWHIHAYFHLKAKCRMLINDSMIIEVFQTGQLAVDSNRGRVSQSDTDKPSVINEVSGTMGIFGELHIQSGNHGKLSPFKSPPNFITFLG